MPVQKGTPVPKGEKMIFGIIIILVVFFVVGGLIWFAGSGKSGNDIIDKLR